MMRHLRGTRFWRERSPREQSLLILAALVLAIVFVDSVLIDPALDGRRFWQEALPQLRADRVRMHALANQLRSEASATPGEMAGRLVGRAQIERSLSDSGIKPLLLEVSDGLIRLRCSDISFDSLNRWLQQMHSERAYVVIEASISARERVGQVDASVSLRSMGTSP